MLIIGRVVRLPVLRRNDVGEYIRADRGSLPLTLSFIPVSVTFSLIDEYVVADPTESEEALQRSSLTIVLDAANKDILSMRMPGGKPVTAALMSTCFDVTEKRISELKQLLDDAQQHSQR